MREFKFRAWDIVNRKMYLDELESVAFAKNGLPANVSVAGFSRPLMAIGVEPQIVLQQFTGLKDKNGKEIYDGDITRDAENNVADIEWRRSAFCRKDRKQKHFYPLTDDCEVIGNIYENPELLQ